MPVASHIKYLRKIIKISAIDSPNVQYALTERAKGLTPSNKQVIPGVLSWEEYQKRRQTWDEIRQCIGLDANFWEGKELLLYPPQWLAWANTRDNFLRLGLVPERRGAAIGIDTAEGGDKTCMCVVDRLGILELTSEKTSDTSIIPGKVIALGKKWGVPPQFWTFDIGGGGKGHTDHLRAKGYPVRAVGFGESPRSKIRARLKKIMIEEVNMEREERYAYVDRRAEMYHKVRLLLDPVENRDGYGISRHYTELLTQMSLIPLLYDGEGRIYLPPKHRRGRTGEANKSRGSFEKTLVELIGHSPDELDSFALAVHTLTEPVEKFTAGAAW